MVPVLSYNSSKTLDTLIIYLFFDFFEPRNFTKSGWGLHRRPFFNGGGYTWAGGMSPPSHASASACR